MITQDDTSKDDTENENVPDTGNLYLQLTQQQHVTNQMKEDKETICDDLCGSTSSSPTPLYTPPPPRRISLPNGKQPVAFKVRFSAFFS